MWIIKHRATSFTGRVQYRTVKDLRFETRELAQAWIDALPALALPKRYHVEEAAPPQAPRTETHCQICERNILANTGVIAHHGYQRPGFGWQTASCFGARYRPFEVACDAIPLAITSLKKYVAHKYAALDQHTARPPSGYEAHEYSREHREPRPHHSVLRPAGWPDRDPHSEPGSYEERDARPFYRERCAQWKEYERHHNATLAQLTQQIKFGLDDIARLERRLASWKPLTIPKDHARKTA